MAKVLTLDISEDDKVGVCITEGARILYVGCATEVIAEHQYEVVIINEQIFTRS